MSKKTAFLFFAISILSIGKACAQSYAVKTDVLGLATGTINAEWSVGLHKHWTLHTPVAYNPWSFGSTKMKQLTFQPGVRYWIDQSYGYGWFIGSHVIVSRYDISGFFTNNRRYDGNGYGIGASFGFSLPIHHSWNLDFELGASAFYTKYDKYDCATCEPKYPGEETYLIPTKLSVNLVYLF